MSLAASLHAKALARERIVERVRKHKTSATDRAVQHINHFESASLGRRICGMQRSLRHTTHTLDLNRKHFIQDRRKSMQQVLVLDNSGQVSRGASKKTRIEKTDGEKSKLLEILERHNKRRESITAYETFNFPSVRSRRRRSLYKVAKPVITLPPIKQEQSEDELIDSNKQNSANHVTPSDNISPEVPSPIASEPQPLEAKGTKICQETPVPVKDPPIFQVSRRSIKGAFFAAPVRPKIDRTGAEVDGIDQHRENDIVMNKKTPLPDIGKSRADAEENTDSGIDSPTCIPDSADGFTTKEIETPTEGPRAVSISPRHRRPLPIPVAALPLASVGNVNSGFEGLLPYILALDETEMLTYEQKCKEERMRKRVQKQSAWNAQTEGQVRDWIKRCDAARKIRYPSPPPCSPDEEDSQTLFN